ncbi:hypothetical protein CMQ_2830 [Grosmannia clavigera kw1407]|uniref:Uncharacterized protein n=1 Tax=Grosmannia clavigera (strain kw1407 / UAMH 11150) TaxID=655863 RepID=F0XI77_GROCL|nr:uncharacterized protein CMQ_2830 [Grosmannia clavigera kw1407]EFX02901.1 hypothetical protein CMQ_2830 [Grosmannia clavigera kw1407]
MSDHGTNPCDDETQIALVCALGESDAVSLLFDEPWNDINDKYGRIGQHNVAVSFSSISSDTTTAEDLDLLSRYPALKLALFIDVGRSMRTVGKREVKLGDVLISNIVIQHGKLRLRGTAASRQSNGPSSLIQEVKTEWGRKRLMDNTAKHLHTLQEKASKADCDQNYLPPQVDHDHDQMFVDSNEHKQPWRSSDRDGVEARSYRPVQDPTIVKKQKKEDRISPRIFFVPFEQLGLTLPSFEDSIPGDEFPGLFIRGVSGFVDGQDKDGDEWQPFSAAAAAATTKALLERCVLTASSAQPAATTDAYRMINHFGAQNHGVQAGSIGTISGFTFGRGGSS